jgi:hypothetical protein
LDHARMRDGVLLVPLGRRDLLTELRDLSRRQARLGP